MLKFILNNKGLFLKHIPVLLNEVIEIFKDTDSGYIVDCTTGLGGHSGAILRANKNIKMICIDRDIEAINIAKENLKEFENRVIFTHGSYSQEIKKFINYDVKGILADIGVSSLQLDKSDRGFQFNSEKLDMRMNQDAKLSAYDVVNYYSIEELERVFREYGEVREYKKLARAIIDRRKEAKIESALELSTFIERHLHKSKLHPATLAFQGIRIEVNDELGELSRLLEFLETTPFKNVKIGIISFHSLEDRIVKQAYKEFSKRCICSSDVFKCKCGGDNDKGKILTKKPIIPTPKEVKENPRSRSSKLRVFQFGDNSG